MNDQHQKFSYQSLDELIQDMQERGIPIPCSRSCGVLGQVLPLGRQQLDNRLVVQPMEGCDGLEDGSPSDLTVRRYRRFGAGGAGMIWLEATAVVHAGRANPRQLMLTDNNLPAFAGLSQLINQAAGRKVYQVLQLTHSGRYSRPDGQPHPLVAAPNRWLDQAERPVTVLTDDELAELVPAYVTSARLAREAGFDAVDIKACHGYLINELLGARERPGRYGGSLENRMRFLLQVVDAVRNEVAIDLAVRLNAYDEVPRPYGWGVDATDFHQPDWQELHTLLTALQKKEVTIVNITGGNPYYNPHVNRPFDSGPYMPPFHPLVHAAKLFEAARQARQIIPQAAVVASGLSWFRHFGGHLAAGLVESGWCDLAGFGRQAFAYPDFARELLASGMRLQNCCIACGKCSEIMRDGGMSGCVIHDRNPYQMIYQRGRAGKSSLVSRDIREHV